MGTDARIVFPVPAGSSVSRDINMESRGLTSANTPQLRLISIHPLLESWTLEKVATCPRLTVLEDMGMFLVGLDVGEPLDESLLLFI
jgi:hypothetical protein